TNETGNTDAGEAVADNCVIDTIRSTIPARNRKRNSAARVIGDNITNDIDGTPIKAIKGVSPIIHEIIAYKSRRCLVGGKNTVGGVAHDNIALEKTGGSPVDVIKCRSAAIGDIIAHHQW